MPAFGSEEESKRVLLAMALAKGVIRSLIRIFGRKLPCRAQHPLYSRSFSTQCVRNQRPAVIYIPLIPPTKSPCGSFPLERY